MNHLRSDRWLQGAAIVTMAWALLCASCSHDRTPLYWLDEVSRANEMADQAIAEGQLDTARNALRNIVDRSIPSGIAPEDGRVVIQDLCYRLGEIELMDSQPSRAIEWVERGLALGAANDVFTANLFVVRGRAHEALDDDQSAISDYYRALEITETLLRQSLPEQEEP